MRNLLEQFSRLVNSKSRFTTWYGSHRMLGISFRFVMCSKNAYSWKFLEAKCWKLSVFAVHGKVYNNSCGRTGVQSGKSLVELSVCWCPSDLCERLQSQIPFEQTLFILKIKSLSSFKTAKFQFMRRISTGVETTLTESAEQGGKTGIYLHREIYVSSLSIY